MLEALVSWLSGLLSRLFPPVLIRLRDDRGRSADVAIGHRAIMMLEKESRRLRRRRNG